MNNFKISFRNKMTSKLSKSEVKTAAQMASRTNKKFLNYIKNVAEQRDKLLVRDEN
jgi:hypothetical protein